MPEIVFDGGLDPVRDSRSEAVLDPVRNGEPGAAFGSGHFDPGEFVVIGDRHGALTLGAAVLGARGIRTYQDPLLGERALARNAERLGLSGVYAAHDALDESLLSGARTVLLQLPRGLDALDEIAWSIARWAAPDVRVHAGGRVKHMTRAQNEVLARYFGEVSAGLGRRKSRVLTAREARDPGPAPFPRWGADPDLPFRVAAYGATFGGPTLDHGSRLLLSTLERDPARGPSAPDTPAPADSAPVATFPASAVPTASAAASPPSAADTAAPAAPVTHSGASGRRKWSVSEGGSSRLRLPDGGGEREQHGAGVGAAVGVGGRRGPGAGAGAGAAVGAEVNAKTEARAGARTPTRIVDLGCGNGVLAVWAALAFPRARVIATDQSAAAVAATRLTAEAAGVLDRVDIHRADALEAVPDGWADLILLNPPFHTGATVHAGVAHRLIRACGRALGPGGELRLVFNSHLRYRPIVERSVGPARELARDRTFTVLSAIHR
ncbi:MAG: class I SAM-dependent methyltransferase [Leucobacter sp.]